jgi:hypothetical protein
MTTSEQLRSATEKSMLNWPWYARRRADMQEKTIKCMNCKTVIMAIDAIVSKIYQSGDKYRICKKCNASICRIPHGGYYDD